MFRALNVQRSQKFVWQSEQKCFQQKYVQYLKSVKEPKIRMGATRRILQAQPKILKKLTEHQIYQTKRKFCQKSMFSGLKVKKSQKFALELPDEIRPGSLKNNRTQVNCRKP
jgi:hypothetical protein